MTITELKADLESKVNWVGESYYDDTPRLLGATFAADNPLSKACYWPVKYRQANGLLTTGKQYFSVDNLGEDSETAEYIVNEFSDYDESTVDIFSDEVYEFVEAQYEASPASVVIESVDSKSKFAICTVYVETDGVVSPVKKFVTDDGDGLTMKDYSA